MKRYIVVEIGILIFSAHLWSQAGNVTQTAGRVPAFKTVEYLLLGDATRGAGEPMIAVDPTNPKNIVATAMGTLGELPPPPPGGRPGTQSIPRSSIPWLAVTHDGGTTWDVGELPIMKGTTFTRCPDAMADVTKEGVFLLGCEPRETTGEQYGMSALVASTDKGITWGPLVEIISSFGAARFAPGLKPEFKGASPWDRPYTFIDDSTGVIYAMARGGSTAIDAPPGQTRTQSYITASTDGGRSFGTIYSWESKDYPQFGRGVENIGLAAAHGVAAITYISGKAPNATCPCAVFGLTRDQGKTFSYHVLNNITVQADAKTAGPGMLRPNSPETGGLTSLSADQTKAGRFAILKYENVSYSVAISEDYGQTWGPFVTAGTVAGATSFTKPAFEFSRDGVIGLMWRADYADKSYDIWSSISRDGGKIFSNSLRVSHAKSPASLPVKGAGNDDHADLCMDKENIHMVWGDLRTGFMGTWYGRVAFSAFEFPLR